MGVVSKRTGGYDSFMEMIFDSHLHFFTREVIRFYSQQSPEFSQLKDPTDSASDKLGIFPPPENPQELAKLWVKELDRNKVSRAVLFGSIIGEQASIEKAINLFPNRFVGFQLVDPTNPAAPDIVEDIVSKKLSGLLLFPALHHFFPDDLSCVRLYELARKFKLIVFVHIGELKILIQEKLGSASQCIQEFGDAQRLGRILGKFPEVSFIVPHFGCGQLDGLIEPARESRNLYLDTSSSNSWLQHNSKFSNLKELFENVLEEKAFGIERLLFGTDSTVFPRGWRKDIYEIQRKALDDLGVTSTDLSLFLNKNLEKLVNRF